MEPDRGHPLQRPVAAYTLRMTLKEKVLRAVDQLPDDASLEDIMERVYFLLKVQRGIEDADAGRTVPHSEVRERFLRD